MHHQSNHDDTTLENNYMEKDDSKTVINLLTAAKQFCIDNIEIALTENDGEPEEVVLSIRRWLNQINAADAIAIYRDLNKQLPKINGLVVETNVTLANVTGGSTHAVLLGNTQQSKASLFYVAPYICKDKVALESCVTALARAQAHISKYPSRAEDSGTVK
jgi:hypothetical protein